MCRSAIGTPIVDATARCESVAIRRNRSSVSSVVETFSHAELIGIPFESELARRRHIPNERGGRHDGRTGEIAFAAEAHPILPVPIERRDRTLSFLKRVGTLTETRTAPRLSDLAANGSEHIQIGRASCRERRES